MREKTVADRDTQHERSGDRCTGVSLNGEILCNIKQTNHVAHGSPVDFVDAAVMRPVFAAVGIGKHQVQGGVGQVDAYPFDLIDLTCQEGHELFERVQIIIDHFAHAQIVIHVGGDACSLSRTSSCTKAVASVI